MSALVVYGRALDPAGLGMRYELVPGARQGLPVLRTRFRHLDSTALRTRQPRGRLAIGHDRRIGEIAGIDRSDDGAVWVTAITEDQAAIRQLLRDRDPWFFSLETESRRDDGGHETNVVVTGVGLTHEPSFGRAALGLSACSLATSTAPPTAAAGHSTASTANA
jgi:hypothetical protein